MTSSVFIGKVNGVTRMAVNMSELVPDNNLNWLALAACVYGNISAGRALCDLDGNSLLKMYGSGMSLRAISYKVGADYKTVKRALMMLGVKF